MLRAIQSLLVVMALSFMVSLLANSQAQAQQINQANQGLSLAKLACSPMSRRREEVALRSPDPAAPRFKDIANSPGMSATAISVALQTTPHRTMPKFKPNKEALDALVIYILSLKRG